MADCSTRRLPRPHGEVIAMQSFDRYPRSSRQGKRDPRTAIVYRWLVPMLTVGARAGDGSLTLADLPGFVSYRCVVRACAAVTAINRSVDRVRPRRHSDYERRASFLG